MKTISSMKRLSGLVLVLTGIGVGMVLVSQNQDIRQQASVGTFDSLQCLDGECTTSLASNGNSYISTLGSYKVTFDENRWKQTSLPSSASKNDTENSMFVFKSNDGFASIYLNAAALTDSERLMSMEDFGKYLSTKVSKTTSGKWGEKTAFVSMSIEEIGEKHFIKLNYETTFLGNTVPFSEYIYKGRNHYVEAEAKLIHTPQSTQAIQAFLSGLVVDPQDLSQVKGISTSLDETKLTELVKPSVVSVLHTYCKNIRVKQGGQLTYLKSSYAFCNGGFGSGFVVSEQGLIATNGHVVVTYPEEDIIGGLIEENPSVVSFVVDFVREILLAEGMATDQSSGYQITGLILNDPTKAQALLESLYKLLDSKLISIESTEDNFYVNTGHNPFELDKESGLTPSTIGSFVKLATGQYKAKLSTYDYGNSFAKEVLLDKKGVQGSDVALIQLENNSGYKFPALELTDSAKVKEGESLMIIGFPGLVSGADNNGILDYKSSSTQATITRGIVSSIKKDASGNTLIQTDASIEHGNSGGPAFNQQGQVIGIATYGFQSQAGNYNFLRDIADLQKLAEKKSITLSDTKETYENWTTGLGYFWNDRYTRSVKHLTKVAANYPSHPSVSEYIDDAKENIKNGKDIDLMFGVEKTYVYTGGVVGGVLLLMGIIIFIISRKHQPRVENFSQPVATTAYAPPSPVQPTFAAMATNYPGVAPQPPAQQITPPVQPPQQ